MKNLACLALLLAMATTAQAAGPALPTTADIVPVTALAGQSSDAVANQLGAADSCERGKYGRRCFYQGGAVEIVYTAAGADWFTIYPKDAFLTASSLRQLSLPTDAPPAAETAEFIRWQGLAGLTEVTAYVGEGGKVSYFYVKAYTP